MTQKSERYPIGLHERREEYDRSATMNAVHAIDRLPFKLEQLTANLSTEQLNSTYRQGSWNVRQLVHHIADSHMNGYIRTKWALTEDSPLIKPYDENAWSDLSDAKDLPVEVSLKLISAVHQRWAYLLRNLTDEEWQRTFTHPEHDGTQVLFDYIASYAWHGEHHLAHIEVALK